MIPRIAFLTAEWRNLLLANYSIDPGILRPYLPRGVEPDLLDGKAQCSLVAFQFLNTRVGGVQWPGFRHFPEWNLRFYLRRGNQRGVGFVREFVPQRWVATVAQSLYNEPYAAVPIGGKVIKDDQELRAHYQVRVGGRVHRMQALAEATANLPTEGGLEDWFKEQRWGFGRWKFGRTIRYEVVHPRWRVHRVKDFTANVDWGLLYGKRWEIMNDREPDSVMLAEGSAVSVYPFRVLS